MSLGGSPPTRPKSLVLYSLKIPPADSCLSSCLSRRFDQKVAQRTDKTCRIFIRKIVGSIRDLNELTVGDCLRYIRYYRTHLSQRMGAIDQHGWTADLSKGRPFQPG